MLAIGLIELMPILLHALEQRNWKAKMRQFLSDAFSDLSSEEREAGIACEEREAGIACEEREAGIAWHVQRQRLSVWSIKE